MIVSLCFSCRSVVIKASHLIKTMWCLLRIYIWIIMHTYSNQKLSEHLSAGMLPTVCLFICTCFCRTPDKLHTDEYLSPRVLWQIAAFECAAFHADQWSLWSLNKAETMGFDGQISSRVARLHHMVHVLTATLTVCHCLSLQQWTRD